MVKRIYGRNSLKDDYQRFTQNGFQNLIYNIYTKKYFTKNEKSI
jgi:hypothetical protein